MEGPFQFAEDYPSYFEPGESCVRTEYLDELARAIAGRFEQESGFRAKDRKNPLSVHQLRAFYQHAKKAQAMGDPACAVNEIRKLAFHARDRAGRSKPKVSSFFRQFIERNVVKVEDERGLRAILEHFEAVVGFSTGRLRERDER